MNLDHNSGGGQQQQQQQLLSPIIAKALGDKLYEKRKAAALEVER